VNDRRLAVRHKLVQEAIALAILDFFESSGNDGSRDHFSGEGKQCRSEASGRSSAESGGEESPDSKGRGSR